MDVRRSPQETETAEQEPASRLRAIPWHITARIAVIGIFLVLLCAALDLGRTLLLPIISAMVIGLMLGPLAALASRYRIPEWLSAALLLALFIAVVAGAITLLSAPLVEWIGKAPDIARIVGEKLAVLDRPLAALNEVRDALRPKGNTAVEVDVGPGFFTPALTIVTPALGELLVFVGTLYFYLLGRNELRRKLVTAFSERDVRLRAIRALNDIEDELTSYLSVVTIINLFVGCGTAVIAYLAGLPNFGVWAVMAFVLNYVPYLGPLIMNLVLFAVGIVTFPTVGQALVAPACFIAMTTLEGHFITPSIMGKRLTLNPLNVFLSLAFWTWLWGPVGAFLAVPLLITGMVALRHFLPKPEMNLPG